jgi:hypothetical protein
LFLATCWGGSHVAPSDKVNLAIIGCGGQARTNTRALFQLAGAQIIAVADPIEAFSLDEFYYKGMGGRKPLKAEIEKHFGQKTPHYRCAEYEDSRVILEKERAIDAILRLPFPPVWSHAPIGPTDASRARAPEVRLKPAPPRPKKQPEPGVPAGKERFGDNLLSRKLYSHYHRQGSV